MDESSIKLDKGLKEEEQKKKGEETKKIQGMDALNGNITKLQGHRDGKNATQEFMRHYDIEVRKRLRISTYNKGRGSTYACTSPSWNAWKKTLQRPRHTGASGPAHRAQDGDATQRVEAAGAT